MPKPSALQPKQAKESLAHRLGPRVDRIRQLATQLGIRPYRVHLVWTAFAGDERGEGAEVEVRRIEILPTPRVVPFVINHTMFPIGWIPTGMLRLQLIGVSFTEDMLTGRWVPEPHELVIPQPFNFRYEIVEDGRGDPQPRARKYRLASTPFRKAGSISWEILLERIGTDNDLPSTGSGANPCR